MAVERASSREPGRELWRELWFVGPEKVEVRPALPLPELGDGDVKVRALYSGLSQGTELLLYRGEGPLLFDPSLAASQPPETALYPRRYGYAWVGEVVDSRDPAFTPGQHVFALRPHGDVHVLRPQDLRRLPAALPAVRATLAASLETALTVVWDAGLALGDDVVVLGGGTVGLLTAMLAKKAGAARVRLIEPSPRRRQAGVWLGCDAALAPEQATPSGDADVVIEVTGDPACLDQAILHAAQEATVVVASFYGERRSPVSLGTEFHRRRLRLKSSQVSHVPPSKTARWDLDRRFTRVLDYLQDERLDAIIEPPVPFAQAPSLFADLNANPGAALHSVFAYR